MLRFFQICLIKPGKQYLFLNQVIVDDVLHKIDILRSISNIFADDQIMDFKAQTRMLAGVRVLYPYQTTLPARSARSGLLSG